MMTGTADLHVTEALKGLRERAGLSMERLARACGYKGASSYQRYEDPALYHREFLPQELAVRLAEALAGRGDPPISRDEVLALAGIGASPPSAPAAEGALPAGAAPLPGMAAFPRDLPVYGVAVGGADGDFSFNGSVVDYVRRPPALAMVADAFAVYVIGDSMSPRYEHGDLVFVHPGRPAQPGSDVVVELHGEHGEPGPCYVKRLMRRTPDRVLLAQFNPPRDDIAFAAGHIKAVYRILTPAELLGV